MVGRQVLRFSQGNSKLSQYISILNLPAGHACPFAKQCLSKADRVTGKLTDGKNISFRCHEASIEVRRPNVRDSRWHNFQLLRSCRTKRDMISLLSYSLSELASYARFHGGGDFFSQTYFDAVLGLAVLRPKTTFYGYTKSVLYWVKRLPLPPNFILTASYGGTHDHLIEEYGLRSAKVVFSKEQAQAEGLELDHDDSHAMKPGPSFALLLHGPQPKQSPAARALSQLWKQGEYGYGKRADARRLALQLV